MTSKLDSKRKRVLITGATDGIGFRLLKLLCEEGADVIGTGSRAIEALPDDWPPEARYLQADQRKPRVASKILKYLNDEGWKWIDHLILNAGSGSLIQPEDESADALEETLAVNLYAPVLITHALCKKLEGTRSGKVTLIGSVARRGNRNFASYAAAKAGINGFGRALSSEWRDRIAVQVINPGAVATDMHTKAGLPRRWFHRLFINPDFAAGRVLELINSNKPVAKIGHFEWMCGAIQSRILPDTRK